MGDKECKRRKGSSHNHNMRRRESDDRGSKGRTDSHHSGRAKSKKESTAPTGLADESKGVDELLIRQRERAEAERARAEQQGQAPCHTQTEDTEGLQDGAAEEIVMPDPSGEVDSDELE